MKLRNQKQEREQLVRSRRSSGSSWVEVAEALRCRYGVNARVAFRYAHGWSQRQAADEWNRRWPDELKTFKNFSYWETWPGSTGHAPTFDNLSKLAELYECAVSDLLVDLSNFRHLDDAVAASDTIGTRQHSTGAIPGISPVSTVADELPSSDDISALLVPYLVDVKAFVRSNFATQREREIAYDRLVQLLSGWANTMQRRKLLRSLGWAASAVAAMPLLEGLPPEEQIRVAQAVETPDRIDATTIEHIEAVLWSCIRQDDALGAQATLDTVCAQRNLVRLILPECPAELRPRLLSLYSNYSLQAGWLFYDLNDFDSASYYYEHARATAHEAETPTLVRWCSVP